MKLDDWLHPALRQVPVNKPLFIVGMPRSGTTLLHRLIASERSVFTTMALWELLLAPAVCEKEFLRRLRAIDRSLGSPLWHLFCRIQRIATHSFQDIHPTTLQSPEEDYLALLPFGGCFLRVICFPWDPEVWKLGHFGDLDPATRKRLISTYKRVLQRHLFFRGSHLHLLSKNPSLTSWLPELLDVFPDACFIGLHRAPEQAVPSQLSSLRAGMAFFGTEVADPEIVDRFVKLLASYWNILRAANRVLPRARFQLIDFEELVGNSFDSVCELLEQFRYPLSEQGLTELARNCSQQRGYRSKHQYSLEDYGLERRKLDLLFAPAEDEAPFESFALASAEREPFEHKMDKAIP